MTYDFHIHDALRVEYRVATDGSSFPRGYSFIERETRGAGGNGAVAAAALAKWGARVLLTGNPIGDDEHGHLLQRELEAVENLDFAPEVRPGLATPYAVLLRAGGFDVGTLLSPQAARIALPRLSRNEEKARFFGGAVEAWGEVEGEAILEAATQEYGSLVGAIAGVAAIYEQLMGAQLSRRTHAQLGEAATQLYRERFGGLGAIPTLEELESYLSAAR